jgi:ribosome maturation protein SDO1
MSRQITQPVNQVRLTNVAVVRLTRHGHRFEVACYRNKIVNYRQGTETDLSEVLQTTTVFTNVSKGQFAKSSLLQECFGTSDEEEVCRFILEKGEVQISDQERAAMLENMLREVASMVSEKCINPVNRRQYTMAQIREAMKSAGFMVHPTKNVKQQFLDCVRLLQETKVLNIERAKMLLVIVLMPLDDDDNDFANRRSAAVELLTEAGVASAHIKRASEENRLIFQADPSLYRKLESIAKDSSVKGRVEIIQQCVTEEGDVQLGFDATAHQQQHPNATDEYNEQRTNTSEDFDTSLSNQFKDNLNVTDSASSPIQDTNSAPFNSRKAQKAAQKKSKKAKRREKEEQAEKEERIRAEKERQKERAERLGLTEADNEAKVEDTSAQGGETKSCNTCGGNFTPGEYRAHFRSDWHRFNVKLKMKGVPAVSEKEFQLCDADEFF